MTAFTDNHLGGGPSACIVVTEKDSVSERMCERVSERGTDIDFNLI